jgi:hypothetical protein
MFSSLSIREGEKEGETSRRRRRMIGGDQEGEEEREEKLISGFRTCILAIDLSGSIAPEGI